MVGRGGLYPCYQEQSQVVYLLLLPLRLPPPLSLSNGQPYNCCTVDTWATLGFFRLLWHGLVGWEQGPTIGRVAGSVRQRAGRGWETFGGHVRKVVLIAVRSPSSRPADAQWHGGKTRCGGQRHSRTHTVAHGQRRRERGTWQGETEGRFCETGTWG